MDRGMDLEKDNSKDCMHGIKSNYDVKLTRFRVELKNKEILEIETNSYICKECNEPWMDKKQMSEFLRIYNDAK